LPEFYFLIKSNSINSGSDKKVIKSNFRYLKRLLHGGFPPCYPMLETSDHHVLGLPRCFLSQTYIAPQFAWRLNPSLLRQSAEGNRTGLAFIFFSHLHIRTFSHPHIRTSAHPHIRTSAHPHIRTSAHPHIRTSAHPHIRTSAHPHICTSAHLHIRTSAHLHICTSAHPHIRTSAHLHICTSAHPHIPRPLQIPSKIRIFECPPASFIQSHPQ
jgi:hypothetical protein